MNRNFYAIQKERAGSTMWRFATRAERDDFVQRGLFRAAVPASDVDRTFRAKGQFVRWAQAAFARPVARFTDAA